jgi:plasmid stability protein
VSCPKLIVRRLDDDLVRRLKAKAAAHGRLAKRTPRQFLIVPIIDPWRGA